MKSKYYLVLSLILTLTLILVLLSACFNPEAGPPILDGEQRVIIEDGSYQYEIIEEDTTLVFCVDYYISRDSCVRGNFSIAWQNGQSIYMNIDYLFSIVEYAGIWYEWNGIVPVSKSIIESSGDPVLTLEFYNDTTLLTARDTLELVEDPSDSVQ